VSIIDALSNLPRPIARHTLFMLTEALPPPLGNLPEERAARDEAAVAAVADLQPADAYQARLAARSVGADAHAMDCLRLAALAGRDSDEARRCRAQAVAMARTAEAALRSLRAQQAAGARPADAATPALDEAPAPPVPAPAEPPPSDILAEANEYALNHRKRAALIRRLRRLPERIDCGPMRPQLLHAIITGTSPILCSLDPPADNKLRQAA
jgi:hypothetical protein